jgi:hypothetical protein
MTAVPACVWAHVRVREREWEVRVTMHGGYQIFHNFWRYRISAAKKAKNNVILCGSYWLPKISCYILWFLLAAENLLSFLPANLKSPKFM